MLRRQEPRSLPSSLLGAVGAAYVSFAVLAIPETALGIAWPAMREGFQVSLEALGLLLILSRIGQVIAGAVSGRWTARYGYGRLMIAAGAVRFVGLLGMMWAPGWPALLLLGVVSGLAGGLLVAVLNTFFAGLEDSRLMNWLHASFGFGAFLGPVIMTGVLGTGLSWRVGYGLAGGLQLAATGLVLRTLSGWHVAGAAPQVRRAEGPVASWRQTLRLPAMGIAILLFLVSAGLEATAGQWTFALFTEGRGIPVVQAGFWVSAYWATFTMGRAAFGLLGNRRHDGSVLRVGMLTAMGLTLWLWLSPDPFAGLPALGLLGLALAPISPLLTAGTRQRLGAAHMANGVGFQVSAASAGISLLPALAGVLADRVSLESLSPLLFLLAVAQFILGEISRRKGIHDRPLPPP